MNLHARGWLVALTLSTSLLVGCAHQDYIKVGEARPVNFATDVAVGDPYVDFLILTAEGEEVTFSAVRGRATVLLLPEPDVVITCDQLDRWAEVVEQASTCDVHAVAVAVVRSAACARILDASLECDAPWDHFVLVCDPHGDIENLYGPRGRGQYFVLDNYLKIAGTGPLEARAEMRVTLKNVVEEICEYDRRAGSHQWH